MNTLTRLSVAEIERLATRALLGSDVSVANASAVARSVAFAERDGQQIVGLSYLPTYCAHSTVHKVDGHAQPELTRFSAVAIRVDAKTGFAHPALALGLPALAQGALEHGLAALSVGNSYACGSLGYFVEELAEQGLVALMFANASPSMAPFGGNKPFFGTNPIAFAVPREGAPPLVIDQSSSVVAMVAILDADRSGRPLSPGWAIDAEGQATTDAQAAMSGSLLPIGGYKGAGLALLVDILAGGLADSHLSFEASSFGDNTGGPPRTGQFIIAIDPARFGGAGFARHVTTMLERMVEQPGVRLPGDRRLSARRASEQGIDVPSDLIARLEQLGTGAGAEGRSA